MATAEIERVQLHLYDVTGGLARQMSPMLLGREVEGVWHTGLVVGGVEYSYGPTLRRSFPGQTPLGIPDRVLELGATAVSSGLREELIHELVQKYSPNTYDLLFNNCTHFCNELSTLLTGNGLPHEVLGQLQALLDTPLGESLLNMFNGAAPDPAFANAYGDLIRDVMHNLGRAGMFGGGPGGPFAGRFGAGMGGPACGAMGRRGCGGMDGSSFAGTGGRGGCGGRFDGWKRGGCGGHGHHHGHGHGHGGGYGACGAGQGDEVDAKQAAQQRVNMEEAAAAAAAGNPSGLTAEQKDAEAAALASGAATAGAAVPPAAATAAQQMDTAKDGAATAGSDWDMVAAEQQEPAAADDENQQ